MAQAIFDYEQIKILVDMAIHQEKLEAYDEWEIYRMLDMPPERVVVLLNRQHRRRHATDSHPA